MNSIWLDIGIVVIVLFFAVAGHRKGLIKQLINFAGGLVALLLSFLIASAVSSFIYTSFIQDKVREEIKDVMVNTIKENDNISTEDILNVLPEYVKNIVNSNNDYQENISKALEKTDIVTSLETISVNIETVLAPAIKSLIVFIVMVLVFIALKILINMLSSALGLIAKLPIVSQINSLAGAVFGAAEGIVIVVFIVFVIRLITPMLSNVPELLEEENINETILYSQINNMLYDR